jgi:hypothetical protein
MTVARFILVRKIPLITNCPLPPAISPAKLELTKDIAHD